MKNALMFSVCLLLPVFICDGLRVRGASGPLVVRLGESVMLPCSVETPPPMDELEVEWKRNDSGVLVHLWQDGESQPESQNQLYHERAHFFTEEIAHGNFSLFLKNVNSKDAGVYKCVVYTKRDSVETLIEIKEIERLTVSGAHIISAYAGEDITLNCLVESHIQPKNIAEVSWKKIDEELLVLLYQEGEILTESTGVRYVDRVELFSVEEINKGNFSLRLKNVRIEDKGLYMCLVFSGALSANTTVEIQPLGFSYIHIGVFLLCILGFVIGSLILGYLSYTTYKNEDVSRKAKAIQLAHLLCPNISLSVAFIVWGFTEGFFIEEATCSALNFVRIFPLLWIVPHLKTMPDNYSRFMRLFAFVLQYYVVTLVAYYSICVNLLKRGNNIEKGLLIAVVLLPFLFYIFAVAVGFCRGKQLMLNNWSCIFTEVINLVRTLIVIVKYKPRNLYNFIPLLFPCLIMMWCLCYRKNYLCTSVLMLLEVASTLSSIYLHYELVTDVTERDALTCVTVFLHILTLITLFAHLDSLSDSEGHSRNTGAQGSLFHVGVFMFGSVLMVLVNVVALLAELILKARSGGRTVDLRVVLLPAESVFAVFCLDIQASTFWKNRKGFLSNIWDMCSSCGFHQTRQESSELSPTLVAQPSGSQQHASAPLYQAPELHEEMVCSGSNYVEENQVSCTEPCLSQPHRESNLI